MEDMQLQRDVVMGRIASALERIANHYERQDAYQEAERLNYERWLADVARTHLATSARIDAEAVADDQQRGFN
jgi:hypothetical protein